MRKCLPQLFLRSLLETCRSAIGQFFFFLSLVTDPEVFAIINSAQFPSPVSKVVNRSDHSASLGSLRNDDVEGNENGKKAIGLDKENNFARASRILYISLPSLHEYNVTGTGTKDNNFPFLNFDAVL